MTLVQSWIDSLTLLKPKNAQLFIMVTLKSIIEAYKVLAYYYLLLVVILGIYVWSVVTGVSMAKTATITLFALFYQLLLFATCAATRPSIMKKDRTYFKSQMSALLYIAICLLFIPQFFWPTAFSSWYIFLILFFLDSAKGPKNFLLSMWNSLKMIIFNLPLLVVMGVLFQLSAWLISKLMLVTIVRFVSEERALAEAIWIVLLIRNILGALLLPIGVCFYANIYIKKLHDQFDLYFRQS